MSAFLVNVNNRFLGIPKSNRGLADQMVPPRVVFSSVVHNP